MDEAEFEREWRFLQQNGLKESSMRQMRRELGRHYKLAAPSLFREYIYAATAAKYGASLGPTYEAL